MKIIHCADLHLDSKMETNLDENKAKDRRYELLDTFNRMISYAKENDVKAMIIAGDMFDTSKNQQRSIKNRTLSMIKEAKDINFFYLKGNHDKGFFFENGEDQPRNLKFFSQKWTSYEYEGITITGLEFGMDKNLDIYSELILNEYHCNLVVMHGNIMKSGQQEEYIDLNQLKNKYIDYLALGHLHQYQEDKLDRRGIWCYSGCLEGRGFDECGKKGFVVLNIEKGVITTEFVSLSKREIHEIQVDITDEVEMNKIRKKVNEGISTIPEKDLLKIVLTGTITEETDLDMEDLEQETKGKYYVCKIVNETKPKIDYLKYENDLSLKGEFIRKVKSLEDVCDEEKDQIILLGIQALFGRDIK